MGNLSTKQLKALKDVLNRADVELVLIFGSYARGDADADSDLDIAVLFDEDVRTEDYASKLFDMEISIDKTEVAFPELDFEILPVSDDDGLKSSIIENHRLVYGDKSLRSIS